MQHLVAFLLFVTPFTLGCDVNEPDVQIGEPITIQSPEFPSRFPRQSRCNFFLQSSAATHFEVNCDLIDLDRPLWGFCLINYLSIDLGSDDRFCGRERGFFRKSPPGMNTFNGAFVSYFRGRRRKGFKCEITFYADAETTSTTESTTTSEIATTDAATTSQPNEECSCGKSTVSRIVGGETVEEKEYPWQAMLMTNNQHFCGGTLIAPNIVLTAAHCTDGFSASSIDVSLGDHSKNIDEAESIVLGVKEIIQHPDYNSATIDNDIALLILEEDVTYSDAIQPACLPFNLNMDEIYDKDVTVTGWGTTSENGNLATVLQEVTLPLISTSSCSSYYPTYITDNMICTYEPGLDSCQGDSGGPLVYDDAGSNYVVGVVSWGVGCAQTNNPGVYAKVTNYLDWIEENTSYDFCKAQ